MREWLGRPRQGTERKEKQGNKYFGWECHYGANKKPGTEAIPRMTPAKTLNSNGEGP